MTKQDIMKKSRKNLSNRFNGTTDNIVLLNKDKNIAEGIADRFQFNVENKAASPIRLALIPSYHDTNELVVVKNGDGVVTDVVLQKSNAAQLNAAGYKVDAVLFDGTKVVGEGANAGELVMCAGDPLRNIANFFEYLKTNPRKLYQLEIVSDDQNAFDTNMELTFANPFFKNTEQTIDLATFFDRYQQQNDRIVIDLDGNELMLSDLSLVIATIPAETKMKFILRFKE